MTALVCRARRNVLPKVHTYTRERSQAARWAPISSGEPRAAALHLYDNYFLFVFVEESARLAGERFSEPTSIVVN